MKDIIIHDLWRWPDRKRAQEYFHEWLCDDLRMRGDAAGIDVTDEIESLEAKLEEYPDDLLFAIDGQTGHILGVLLAAGVVRHG